MEAAACKTICDDLKYLVLHMIEEIVDHDEDGTITVEVLERETYLTVEIETDIRDIGQVVGQGGSVISAIRTIVSAWGGKNRMQVNLVYLTERKKRCPRTASQRA